jgi:hypothetical protein
MRRVVAASVAFTLIVPVASPQGAPDGDTAAHAGPLRSRLTDDAVKDAAKQALAEAPAKQASPTTTVLKGDQYAAFARKLDKATVPDCLHPDALKHVPVNIELSKEWTFSLTQLLPLPFWLAAAATGKCH